MLPFDGYELLTILLQNRIRWGICCSCTSIDHRLHHYFFLPWKKKGTTHTYSFYPRKYIFKGGSLKYGVDPWPTVVMQQLSLRLDIPEHLFFHSMPIRTPVILGANHQVPFHLPSLLATCRLLFYGCPSGNFLDKQHSPKSVPGEELDWEPPTLDSPEKSAYCSWSVLGRLLPFSRWATHKGHSRFS